MDKQAQEEQKRRKKILIFIISASTHQRRDGQSKSMSQVVCRAFLKVHMII